MKDEADVIAGHCFKCKAMKTIAAPTETRLRNGRPAVTGTCITCGTKIFKIIRPTAEKKAESPAV